MVSPELRSGFSAIEVVVKRLKSGRGRFKEEPSVDSILLAMVPVATMTHLTPLVRNSRFGGSALGRLCWMSIGV